MPREHDADAPGQTFARRLDAALELGRQAVTQARVEVAKQVHEATHNPGATRA